MCNREISLLSSVSPRTGYKITITIYFINPSGMTRLTLENSYGVYFQGTRPRLTAKAVKDIY